MTEMPLRARTHDGGLDFHIHVQTRARKEEISGLYHGAIKVKIKAPPVDDAANRAVVDFLARLLDIPRSRIRILSGDRCRDKVVRADGVSMESLEKKLLPKC